VLEELIEEEEEIIKYEMHLEYNVDKIKETIENAFKNSTREVELETN
jgi:cell division protein ZapA (FtsZ GTPase activity inhibitor)